MMVKGNSIGVCASPGSADLIICPQRGFNQFGVRVVQIRSIRGDNQKYFDIFIKMLDFVFEVGQIKIRF